MAITLATGEALVGEGNEVAHIDLLLGSKSGPVGAAFANALVSESEGHTNLLAVVTANLAAKPDTLMTNKVTIKGAKQAVQLFGPAQAAVARAVVASVDEGVIPKDQVDDLVHHRRCLHPLGRRRRQEDLRLQLRGDEAGDRPRAQRRAEHRQGPGRHAGRPPPVRRRHRGLTRVARPRRPGSRRSPACARSSRAPVPGSGAAIAEAFAAAGATVGIGYWRSQRGRRRAGGPARARQSDRCAPT